MVRIGCIFQRRPRCAAVSQTTNNCERHHPWQVAGVGVSHKPSVRLIFYVLRTVGLQDLGLLWSYGLPCWLGLLLLAHKLFVCNQLCKATGVRVEGEAMAKSHLLLCVSLWFSPGACF